MKILLLNGPNLNKLGERNPDVYGADSLEEIINELRSDFPQHEIDSFQSNVEGDIINVIQNTNADAIVLNLGGYSHTSVAIRDALEPIDIPKVEVHISNIHAREEFRQHSITGEVVNGVITGFGKNSYKLGILAAEQLKHNR